MKKLLILAMLASPAFADDVWLGPENGFSLDSCVVKFSPNGGTINELVDYIGSAKISIRMLAYNFTSPEIAKALIIAKSRGVDVQVILDKSAVKEKNGQYQTLIKAGVPTWIDRRHRIAHNKVILVDNEWIETGSFNYTVNAEKYNGENALICHGQKAYLLYRQDWEGHKSHSVTK